MRVLWHGTEWWVSAAFAPGLIGHDSDSVVYIAVYGPEFVNSSMPDDYVSTVICTGFCAIQWG